MRYVITLLRSSAPVRDPELATLRVGAARVVWRRHPAGGAPAFRAQLGYFDTVRAAAAALKQVATRYPGATLSAVRLELPDGVPASGSAPGDARVDSRQFAVELRWSLGVVDVAHVPPLTLFDGLRLYTVCARRCGHDWHGLRLGFFPDRGSAQRLVEQANGYFQGAIAVPVTPAEIALAANAELRPFAARIGIEGFSVG
ncbi:MAG: hypothetical protein JSR54_09305 [Proteobacteria bacterium]|nr:hypothetical protein [Pseudomonadota bacterium]